ncbi:MAG: Ig-like domain-containing protein [Candidatus Xenobiia bacterium LiM19]
MNTRRVFVILTSLILMFASGCKSDGGSGAGGSSQGGASGIQSGNKGTILITAPFPTKEGTPLKKKSSVTSRFIPLNVYIYVVTVCEQGTTTAVVTPVNINRPDSGYTVDATISDVPTGWKTVRIYAYDSNRNLLAQGASDVEVKSTDQGSSDVSVTLTSTSDPPSVSSTTPANGQTGVSINTKVTVLFSMPVLASSLTADTFYLQSSQGKVAGSVSTDGSTAIFAPSGDLLPLTAYTAVVSGNVKNTTGLSMGVDFTWNFTTGEKPDTTPPQVKETSPASGMVNVDTGITISAVFTKNIDPATVTSATFTVKSAMTSVQGTISTLGNSVSFIPSTALQAGAVHTVTLSGAIKDLAGNAMGTDYAWSFTTLASGGGGGGGGGGCTTGTVSGRITRAQVPSSGIDGVSVTLGGHSTTTSGGGYYTLTGVTSGNWAVSFSKSGYSSASSYCTVPSTSSVKVNNALFPSPGWIKISGDTIYGGCGMSGTDIFMGGSNGRMIRYSGGSWSKVNSGTSNTIRGMTMTSATDAYAVGDSGTILHYTGTNWYTAPYVTSNNLFAVSGTSSSRIFAVGASGTIVHYNGTSWSSMTSGTLNDLYGVWCDSTDAFAVGASGTILHYDGTAWTATTAGAANLHGIWGTFSGSDIFAAGDSGAFYTSTDNGVSWSSVAGAPAGNLKGIAGTAVNDYYVAGDSGVLSHYNGAWTSASVSPSCTSNLKAIGGKAANDIYAIGDQDTILHWDGASWSWTSGTAGSAISLGKAYGSSSSNVFASGDSGTVLRFDGFFWKPLNTGTASALSVWCTSDTTPASHVYASGSVIIHSVDNGATWSSSAPPSYRYDIWGTPTGSYVYALGGGDGASAVRLTTDNGVTWNSVASAANDTLFTAWGTAWNDIFAGGIAFSLGQMIHYNGAAWSDMGLTAPKTVIRRIWGSGSSDVYAVGGLPGWDAPPYYIKHYSDSVWNDESYSPNTNSVRGIWGSGAGNIYAAGQKDSGSAMIFHSTGTGTWTRMTDVPYNYDINDLWGTSANDIFAVGESSTILHYGP